MTFEEAKEYAIVQQPTFLPRARTIMGRPSYVCPCCSNGSGRNGTGIQQVPNSNSHPNYHCFKCEATGDIFELAKQYYNFPTMKEAFNFVYDYLGITVDGKQEEDGSRWKNLMANRTAQQEVQEEKKELVDLTPYILEAHKNLDYSYLNNRGLSDRTQDHYVIGTVKNWKNPVTVEKYKKMGKPLNRIPWSPRCIIPTSSYSYLARDTRENINEKMKDYAKQKVGAVSIFNQKFASRQNVVFITEGEIDAMSFYEASDYKVEAVGLGSTSNKRSFLKMCVEDGQFDKKVFVLAMDNDDAGKDACEKFESVFQERGIPYIVMEYEGKDPNESLTKHRDSFSQGIRDCLEKGMDLYKEMIESNKSEAVSVLESEDEREP